MFGRASIIADTIAVAIIATLMITTASVWLLALRRAFRFRRQLGEHPPLRAQHAARFY